MMRAKRLIVAALTSSSIAWCASLAAGCGTTSPAARENAESGPPADAGASPDSPATLPGQLTWFIGINQLQMVAAQDGGRDLADAYFNNPNTFVFVYDNAELPLVPAKSVAALTFSTLRAYLADCGDAGSVQLPGLTYSVDHGVDPRVGAVLYDNENWCITPPAEQTSPDSVEAQAAAIVHAHGLRFLTAPATNLVRAIEPDAAIIQGYLDLGIPAGAGRNADVYDIQSQGVQGNLPVFIHLVTEAAKQARAAHAGVKVLAGLGTNPSSGTPTSFALCQAVMATRDVVDGYWLNIPKPGVGCPKCSEPRPDIAVNLLLQLRQQKCDVAIVP